MLQILGSCTELNEVSGEAWNAKKSGNMAGIIVMDSGNRPQIQKVCADTNCGSRHVPQGGEALLH